MLFCKIEWLPGCFQNPVKQNRIYLGESLVNFDRGGGIPEKMNFTINRCDGNKLKALKSVD